MNGSEGCKHMTAKHVLERLRSRAGTLIVLTMIAIPLLQNPLPIAAAISLRVTPAILSLEAVPGATGEQPITIANEGDEAVEIATGIEPYQGAGGDYSAVDWLSVEPAAFTLNGGKSREAIVRINVPDGIPSGGRYALVTFTTGSGPSGEGSGTSVAGKLGAAMLLVVDGHGDLLEQADLVRFGPVLEPDGRVGFRALISNTGNVHFRPSGSVDLRLGDGAPYASLEIPEERTILPGQQALVSAHGSVPVEDAATYAAVAHFAYGQDGTLTSEHTFAATAALEVAELVVCENLDRGPTLTATLVNSGGLGFFPLVRFAVYTADGNFEGDTSPLQPQLVWGGDTLDIVADFPERLVSGEYQLRVQVMPALPLPDGRTLLPPIDTVQPFAIGGLSGDAASVCIAAGNDG